MGRFLSPHPAMSRPAFVLPMMARNMFLAEKRKCAPSISAIFWKKAFPKSGIKRITKFSGFKILQAVILPALTAIMWTLVNI
jgi:hypothetical protein